MIPAKETDKFAMRGPDGAFVVSKIEGEAATVVRKERAPFLTEEEEEELRKKENGSGAYDLSKFKIPPELKCPFGDHIIKDAVLVPCCGHFICCDECIRAKISNDEVVECPHKDCDQDIGALEAITPDHKMRKMVNDFLNEIKSASQRANRAGQGSSSSKASAASSKSKDLFDLMMNEDSQSDHPSEEDARSNTPGAGENQVDGESDQLKNDDTIDVNDVSENHDEDSNDGSKSSMVLEIDKLNESVCILFSSFTIESGENIN